MWIFQRAAATLAVLASVIVTAALCPADTVKLYGKPAFQTVEILNFDGQTLIFRGLTRETLRVPLSAIQWIESERWPELGVAERNRTSQPAVSADAYDKLLVGELPAWLSRYARLRALQAFDESGHFDRALVSYFRLLLESGDALPMPPPRRPGPLRSPTNQRALDWLQRLREADGIGQGPIVGRLLLELLIYEEAEFPPEFAAVLPDDPLSRQPDPDDSEFLFGTPPPTAVQAAAVTLPLDSYVFAAARAAYENNEHERTIRLLQRALPFVRREDTRPYEYMFGRSLIETERFAEAAERLTPLVDAFDMPETSAQSLYYLGFANERLRRLEAARRMYQALLERPRASAELKGRAREGLSRIGD